MEIKMIVVDLDGTFFRNNKTVSGYTYDIFMKCRQNGIKLAFATARSSNAQIPIELFDGFIRSTGAAVYAYGVMIYDKSIPIQSARELLVAADNAGIRIVAQTNERHCANYDLKQLTGYLDGEIIDFSTLDFKPQKIFALLETPKAAEVLRDNLPDDLYMTISHDGVAMIMHKEATKSKATAALASYWGINQSEIAAFGDDVIDADLLEYCGISVAMGNAIEEIKAMADYICDTNENDGVARWIEKHVLSV